MFNFVIGYIVGMSITFLLCGGIFLKIENTKTVDK